MIVDKNAYNTSSNVPRYFFIATNRRSFNLTDRKGPDPAVAAAIRCEAERPATGGKTDAAAPLFLRHQRGYRTFHYFRQPRLTALAVVRR